MLGVVFFVNFRDFQAFVAKFLYHLKSFVVLTSKFLNFNHFLYVRGLEICNFGHI